MFNNSNTLKKVSSVSGVRFLFCISVFVMSPLVSISQDKIYKTDFSVIEVKLIEISNTEIKYKKLSQPNGPTYIIPKAELWMLVYENGEKEVYNQPGADKQTAPLFIEPTPIVLNDKKDDYSKHDLIIKTNRDSIDCLIDKITKTNISYHIRSRGFDPKGTIALDQVQRYVYKQQWYDANGNAIDGVSRYNERARNYLLSENINDAIALYAKLIQQDSTNATLIAENAYALALAGVYSGALMRLDESWSLGKNSADVNYLTAQVFALMGYEDLANEFWKPSEKNRAPFWISSRSSALLQKYKRKYPIASNTNRDELIADFKHANELASRNLYFQSIALFNKINNAYPNEYLPYLGYSTTLEKTGALNKSAKTIEQAISLMGNNAEDREKKHMLEHRLSSIKQKLASTTDVMPGLHQQNIMNTSNSQMMAYAGGMFAPSVTSLNFRFGYYVSQLSNASLDFGLSNNSGVLTTNAGLSVYSRVKSLVSGAGFQMYTGNNSTTFSVKISGGYSIMNKKKTSSLDIFLDVSKGLKTEAPTVFGISIGTSIYFGKRK